MAQKNLIPHFLAVLGSAGRSLHDQFIASKNPAFTTPDWDLLLVLKGEGGYFVNQKKILVREGDLTLLKPGDHCVPFVVPGRRFDRFFMHFNIPLARDPRLIHQRLSKLSHVNVNALAEIKHLCFCIMREIHEGAEGRLLANHYLSELLIRLIYREKRGVSTRLSGLEEKHSEKLSQVMTTLGLNYSQKTSIAKLANQVHLSPSHLLRLFKKAYGISIHQWLIQKRIDRAKLLLLENSSKISEIARLTGFDSAQHFSTTFSKKTGLSPTAYLASALRLFY